MVIFFLRVSGEGMQASNRTHGLGLLTVGGHRGRPSLPMYPRMLVTCRPGAWWSADLLGDTVRRCFWAVSYPSSPKGGATSLLPAYYVFDKPSTVRNDAPMSMWALSHNRRTIMYRSLR